MINVKNLLIFLLVLVSTFGINAQSFSVEDIVSRHLNSIAPEPERKALKNLVMLGDVQLNVHGSNAFIANGRVLLISELNRQIFRMAIEPPATTKESVVFDGSETVVGRPNLKYIRPDFEQFVLDFKPMVSQGLLGGVLSTGWCMNNLGALAGKVELNGTETLDGRKVYVVRYKPKTSDSVKIKLYFDAETFVHKRTEIKISAPRIRGTLPGGPPPPDLNGTNPNRGFPVRGDIAGPTSDTISYIEDFTNFKQEGKLILPHKYTIRVKSQVLFYQDSEYVIDIKDVFQNQPLDPKTFSIAKEQDSFVIHD